MNDYFPLEAEKIAGGETENLQICTKKDSGI